MRRRSTIAHLPRLPRKGVAVLGALLGLGITVPSYAAPKTAPTTEAEKKKAAREAYNAGEKAYSAGDYKTAAENFRKANELIPSIMAQYWVAMAQSYGSDLAIAIEGLDTIMLSPDAEKLGNEKLDTAAARLKELKATPTDVAFSSDPPGASVALDGKVLEGKTPFTLAVVPGTHKLTVTLAGYEAHNADFTLKPGVKSDQVAVLKKAAAPPPEPPPKVAAKTEPAKPADVPPPEEEAKGGSSNLPAYIALGAGAVGLGIGTFFGIKALGAKSDFDDNPTTANADKAERNALIADMSFGIGLTLGITGAVLLLTSGGDDSSSGSEISAHNGKAPRTLRAHFDVAPIVGPTVQGAAARVSF